MSGRPEEESVESRFLTQELREAFADAAQDDQLWAEARADPRAFLRQMGVAEDGFSVAFLDAEQRGDRIRYIGAGDQVVLEMFCPPGRVWWHFCRRLMRVCEKRTLLINGEEETIDVNCFLVCEEWIWDEQLTISKRPPFPPLPLHERFAAIE
ncbi:MAG TPA: hypothetical protein VFW48_02080 [Solirubrobacterales bacterium]|nr:hypothetical protein [Solirubrobacterales bacterium]